MGLSAGCTLLRLEQLAGVFLEGCVQGLGQEDTSHLGQLCGCFAGAVVGLALGNGLGCHANASISRSLLGKYIESQS